MKTAASVKARLKRRALQEKRNVQDVFTIYVLERVLYRLSVSQYMESFVLKGGILLYAMFDEKYSRTTTDIDLLAVNISNEAKIIREIFMDILSMEQDDPVSFELNTLTVRNITEFKEYHGVNVSVTALLERTRIPVNIDVGFGDSIYPGRLKISCPVTLEEDESPVLFAYSAESVIAEKFEAIVSLGTLNSRYKDFFDIYMLSMNYDFEGATLQQAVQETFEHRGTTMGEISAFKKGFAQDPDRSSRWRGFIRRKRVVCDLSLEAVIEHIIAFIGPVSEALQQGRMIDMFWNHEEQKWISV